FRLKGLLLLPSGLFSHIPGCAFPVPFQCWSVCGQLPAEKRAILTSDSILEVLLSNSEEAVVCFQLDGTILLWNSAAERLYGYAETEIIGKHASLLLPLDELPAFLEILH